MKTLSIDLETRSSVDIAKSGVYRYAEDPDFDILLFGVSVDDGPVRVYDLASGDVIPDNILVALSDNNVMKWAYNANFERICLSVWLRKHYPQHFCAGGPVGPRGRGNPAHLGDGPVGTEEAGPIRMGRIAPSPPARPISLLWEATK